MKNIVGSWTGILFRGPISLIFQWVFILLTQMSHQNSWGPWFYHLSPSHQQAPAAVSGSWTHLLCNPEGWIQELNGICPTKLPASFSDISLNTLVQSWILLETVWVSFGDFGLTWPLEMRLQWKNPESGVDTEWSSPWDVLPPLIGAY